MDTTFIFLGALIFAWFLLINIFFEFMIQIPGYLIYDYLIRFGRTKGIDPKAWQSTAFGIVFWAALFFAWIELT